VRTAIALSLALSSFAVAPPAAAAGSFGLGSLYSCNTAGQRDTTGAVIGGLVGGLAGSQISKNERALGAVAGAAIGAAIGNSIGCRMDRQAAVRAQNAFERALETGRPQTWSDETNGVSGRIEVVGRPGGGPGRSGLRAYRTIGRANVRAQPNVNAQIVDRLQVGEEIRTGAPVNGWLPVIEGGIVQGYVSASAVQPADGGGGDCRTVQETVTTRGYAPETQRYSACRDTSGEWRLTAI
jgi:surface antigen